MPSKDSFSDSRYSQSYEHDHEYHDDHDIGYHSYSNTGMNFGNLSTGSLISDLQKITDPDEQAKSLMTEHESFDTEDFKNKTTKWKDWVVKTLEYLKEHDFLTETPPKTPIWLNFVKSHDVLHDLEGTFPKQHNKTAYNNWKKSVKDACAARRVELPDNLKPRQRKASGASQTPKKPNKSNAKSSTLNKVTTNATAGLIHFTVHEHTGADGLPSVTIKMKQNHPHHHPHHHSKPKD